MVDTVIAVAKVKVLAWCLLPNHYHMVVQTGSIPLRRAMARFQGRYSKGYNRDRPFKRRVR